MTKPTIWVPTRSDTNWATYIHRRWLEAGNFGFRKLRNCTIRVAKTKALISFAVTAKLICAFVFAQSFCWFSYAVAHNITDTESVWCWIYSKINSHICNHWAITFRVFSQCRGNHHRRGSDIRIITPGIFSIAKDGAKIKVLISSLPPGAGAHSRALKAEKS